VDVLIHDFAAVVRDPDGHLYRVRAFGRLRSDGTWVGSLQFTPRGSGGIVWRSPHETTQPNQLALRYWALGLEPVYLEGALERAISASRPARGDASSR
jgi:hypothetical protein